MFVERSISSHIATALRSSLSYISTSEIISETDDNLDEFGLATPSYIIDIKDKSGSVNTLMIGNAIATGEGVYAKTGNNTGVFVLPEYKYSSLIYDSSYYRTMSLYDIDRNTVTAMSVDAYGKHTLKFKENIVEDINTPHNVFNKFQMISPYNWPASGDMVGKILDSFSQMDILEFAAENSADKSAFGFSPYKYKLSAVYAEGKTANIYFGDVKDSIVYVKTDIDDKIYGISYSPFTYLELDPFSYLSNFAFIKNIMTVKSIRYTHNDVKAEFELKQIDSENIDAKKDGKLMSQDLFKTLYTELISISIDGAYTGEAVGEPILSYTFDYHLYDSETVELYKIDDRRAALFIDGNCQFYVNMVDLNKRLKVIDDIITGN